MPAVHASELPAEPVLMAVDGLRLQRALANLAVGRVGIAAQAVAMLVRPPEPAMG